MLLTPDKASGLAAVAHTAKEGDNRALHQCRGRAQGTGRTSPGHGVDEAGHQTRRRLRSLRGLRRPRACSAPVTIRAMLSVTQRPAAAEGRMRQVLALRLAAEQPHV